MQRYHGSSERRAARPAAVVGVAALVVLASWARWRPFRAAIAGGSMRPVLEPGDFVVASARGAVRRGSVVVVERPDRPGLEVVKRVAAVTGDRISAVPGGAFDGRTLERGELWVLGDNPPESTDSRTFGPVESGAVRGVVRFRYWPPRRAGLVAAVSLGGSLERTGSSRPER